MGCGFLGRVLARRLRAAGYAVFGTVRRASASDALVQDGVVPLIVDVSRPATFGTLRSLLDATRPLRVFYLVPPGTTAPGSTPDADHKANGITPVVEKLCTSPLHRAVLASSTGVYGETKGHSVSAETPVTPVSARAQRLFAIEQAWLGLGSAARIVRLAGLYGPGRVIGLTALRAGRPIGGDPDGLLNLIHVDDAAALLQTVAECEGAGTFELGSDGNPIQRADYYGYLAEKLGVNCRFSAQGDTNAYGRRSASRSCDNSSTRARTRWVPRYPDFRIALDGLLHDPDIAGTWSSWRAVIS
ncbi:MAG: NAD-dependent epimerase/dehydratase family protein [Burkholderiales bacterium]